MGPAPLLSAELRKILDWLDLARRADYNVTRPRARDWYGGLAGIV